MPRALTRPSSFVVAPLSVVALVPLLLVSGSTAHAQTQPPATAAPPPAYPPPPADQQQQQYAPPPAQGYPPPQAQGYPPPAQGYPPPAGYAQPGYQPAPAPGYAPPPPAGYPPPPPTYAVGQRPGVETHDGFYMRLQIGGGYTSMTGKGGGNKLELSGGSFGIGAAFGGSLSPNLVLYGAFAVSSISEPEYTENGVSGGNAMNVSANFTGIGIGAAYYLMPVNVYFAGTLMATRLSITDNTDNSGGDNTLGSSELGFGFEALVGKEWWVSDNWGLGGAAQLMVGTMKDKDVFATGDALTWNAVSFSLLFSATYN